MRFQNVPDNNIQNTHLSIDEYIGQKLRDFRERTGLSLVECAQQVGVSHQQIHKYELGQTKLSPGMLYKICKLFLVSPNIFFEDYHPPDDESEHFQNEVIDYNSTKKINIVIIEENSEEQFIIKDIINEYNSFINTFCIHDGSEFLDIVKRRVNVTQMPLPDLIFLDLTVSLLDGISTLRLLKQSNELRHIPVIILTGNIRAPDVMNAYKNYASGYIHKSFEYETLKYHLHLAIRYWTEAVILPTQLLSQSD